MRFIIGISLTTIFIIQGLVPNMDICCELEKLPTLMQHYEEHKAYDGDSFIEFLVEDYLSDEEEGHHDDSQDSELPFHGQHQCPHAPLFCTVEQYFALTQVDALEISQYSMYSFSMVSAYAEAPFQPPKV
ncbi:hypothetical protein BFP72_08625 [Reichenbachiella sp. 5M10]|uniref:hypothetical protein n=1 Tax=Reichenbachiella sp. 5M10 TaxID=1889772 RepID=UPI000C15950F|nr:hypothetical protein [Reichenbachiella sp. 5M10]PIB35452.1 hypothetical protein BFP72_08625 [Reichenbachiella sp. 5M10]